ncbi:hypothetical protein B4U80_09257, partial [Leptotrombidium deliense]
NAFPPTEYLGRIYVDSLLHSTDSILLAKNVLGEDQVMLGSDFPFLLGEDIPGALIEGCSSFTNEIKQKIFYKNALRFLNLNENLFF